MAATDKLAQLKTPTSTGVLPPMPPIPKEVAQRFPTMIAWEAEMQKWVTKVNRVMNGETS